MIDLPFMNSFFPAKYLVCRTFIVVIVVAVAVAVAVANYVLSPARIEAQKSAAHMMISS
jgi:hypothetical protein